MARVTVEDCLEHVENRFKLVLLASKRARQLTLGTEPLVEWENDKPTVVALREIAQDLVNEEMMQASLAMPVAEELEFDEDDLAAALHAEISRELSQTALQSPVTQPPVTQPPVTQPPVTQPPVTQPPVTQPPVTQPPVTEFPIPQEELSPVPSNPIFDGGFNPNTNESSTPTHDVQEEAPAAQSSTPTHDVQEEAPAAQSSTPTHDVQEEAPAAPDSPPADPSPEGEQGF